MADIDLPEVEAAIRRLPDVELVRIVADRDGSPAEIHVVAHPGKSPKQIVRDIQSLTTAALGVTIDHRIVSVVQLEKEMVSAATATATAAQHANGNNADADADADNGVVALVGEGLRLRLESVETDAKGHEAGARVLISSADLEAMGVARGSASKVVRPRLIAEATLEALREFHETARFGDIAHAEVVRAGANDVALVTLACFTPSAAPSTEIVVSGSAVVGAGSWTEAVARAVLDAMNRLIARTPTE